MPTKSFSVKKIVELVGKDRKIHVENCEDQTTSVKTMEQFADYYYSQKKENIYNVLSLEFSDTKMNSFVKRPTIVDELDWAKLSLPPSFRDSLGVTHPKVEKYCIMSVGGSYTSFHIDFGGTSVWYHVLKGSKVFWLIEPTDTNLILFEKWYKTFDLSFFGEAVRNCQRIILEPGMTFFIPSGWIHAVYTPVNSLVFGGNFLHGFNVEMQLRISKMETELGVQQSLRFPLERNLQWFVLELFVRSLSNHSYAENQIKSTICMHKFSEVEMNGVSFLINHLKFDTKESVEGITDLSLLWKQASFIYKAYEDKIKKQNYQKNKLDSKKLKNEDFRIIKNHNEYCKICFTKGCKSCDQCSLSNINCTAKILNLKPFFIICKNMK